MSADSGYRLSVMSRVGSAWRNRPMTWVVVITLFAGLVRLTYIDWDQHHFFHPDERRVAYAVQELSFQPLQLNPKFFAYGSFPIYLTKISTSLLGLVDTAYRSYDNVIHVGRAVSGLIGTLTVLLVILLGTRLYDRSVGLLAGFLLAACVLHVQNSHFSTVDITLTFMVLLALYFLVGVTRQGRSRDYLYAGLAIGFAAATKASALPLMLPLAVAAAYRLLLGDRPGAVVLRTLAGSLAVVIAFGIGQPYALLDFGAFTHDLFEQSHMVRNAGLFPYTNQYVGTPKYFYEIAQIVLIGMAPPLGLAALWASGRRIIGVRRQRAEEVVLLCWVLPFFLVTGWFEVKFIRYLLPIYPIMILWAAEWILRVSRGSRGRAPGVLARLLPATVVVGTLVALLAFLSIYTRPHTVVAASEWLYKFIPPGSKILSQDWDEGFPMPLPRHRPDRYTVVQFGYYEADSPGKMKKLAGELETSDYIAFQTKRLYGALTQADQKFPLSSNYFYLLFAGDLGFTLIQEFASRPGLLGFEVPDELWDESFSVYDHPKVLIFRNDGHLTADEIFDKIMHGLPSKALTRSDLLLARPGAEVGGALSEPIRSSLPALFSFALLVEILGLATYAIVRPWLATVSPYAVAKVLGILLFAYPPWLLVSVGLAGFSRGTLALTVIIIAAIGLGLMRRSRDLAGVADRRDAFAAEGLFWGVFLFFAVVRAFNPEVYWGEKPMDFAFLNALTRAETLPPPEPWFAGHDLNYSYFGYYVAAALGKICHIDPAITFNLAIALFGGLTAVAAFALGNVITGKRRVAVLTAVFVVLLGNLAGPRELIQRGIVNFDYFWATSRVVKETINEYPLWSFLFADLHAHVMVMPFSLIYLTLVVAWAQQRFGSDAARRSPTVVLVILMAFVLGTVMVTNAWSAPTYLFFLPFLLGCYWFACERNRGLVRFSKQLLTRVLLPTAVVVFLANGFLFRGLLVQSLEGWLDADQISWMTRLLLADWWGFYSPFWQHFTPPERNWGWQNDVFVRPQDFAQIFGLFLYAVIPFLFVLWRQRLRRKRPQTAQPPLEVPQPAATAIYPTLLPDEFAGHPKSPATTNSVPPTTETAAPIAEEPDQPVAAAAPRRGFEILRIVLITALVFGLAASVLVSTRTFLLLLGVLALQLALQWQTSERHRVPLAMASFAFFVTAGCDFVYVWDRMNTIFKFYLDSWFLFAAAAAAVSSCLWGQRIAGSIPRAAWRTGFVILIAVALLTGSTSTYGVLTTRRVKTPKPTLNGMLYLEQRAPYELAAYRWLNQRINGIPVVLEAYGPSYQEYARVSMNTGLPTVLGWDYHVFQRAHPWADINRRKSDIQLIYTSDSDEQVRAALARYHVALVYVGPLERRTYPAIDMERLRSWTHVLTPMYENAAVTIFAVNGQFTGAIPVTTIEEVPVVTGEEAPPRQDEEGRFRQPRGVAVDASGAVYVCDFGNNRIQKFTPTLEFSLTWGERGDLPGQFKDPCGIAVGLEDTILVADTWNQRVQVFSAEGRFIREWAAGFYGPRGIAVARQGSVFVSDSGNNRVLRFSSIGEQEAAWGSRGSEPGQFSEPVGIAVDDNERVYVCDNGNGRVQIFTRDGAFVSSFPVLGWQLKVYSEPHIAVDPSGTIWVTVPLEKEVRAYDTNGKLLRTITGTSFPTSPFETPMGLALDRGTNEIVISDLGHRIVRFPYESQE